MPTHIVVEGDLDYVVVSSFGIVPKENLLPVKEQRGKGRDVAMRLACVLCDALPTKSVALVLDLNGKSMVDLQAEVEGIARDTWKSSPSWSGKYWTHGESKLRVVAAGLPGHSLIADQLGYKEYAMDDHVLCLAMDLVVLQGFMGREKRLPTRGKEPGEVIAIVDEVVKLVGTKGIPVRTSKRHLDFIRAVLGFPATRATFAEKLIESADQPTIDSILGEFKRELKSD